MIKNKIAIISLGWLGLALYRFLEDEYEVIGTYNSTKKNVPNQISYDFNTQDLPKSVLEKDIIFLNLPPSNMKNIDRFKHFIDQITHQKLIFISSTSVYGDQGDVDENTILKPNSDNGYFLKDCEQMIADTLKNYTIIRPGGLYGNDRHPGKYLAGRENISGGNLKINLTGLNDLLKVIRKTFADDVPILNAVNQNHPFKKDYYQDYCKKNNLEIPIFINDTALSKIVNTLYPNYSFNTDLP